MPLNDYMQVPFSVAVVHVFFFSFSASSSHNSTSCHAKTNRYVALPPELTYTVNRNIESESFMLRMEIAIVQLRVAPFIFDFLKTNVC